MLALYRTLSVRYLRQRWSRAILVVASIALGVATLVATRVLNQSMSVASLEAASPLAGVAPLHVGNGEAGVRRDLAEQLRQVPGVRGAEPLIAERVLLPDLPGTSTLLVGVGLNDRLAQVFGGEAREMSDNPWGLRFKPTINLNLFSSRKPVLVGKDLAAKLDTSFRILAGGSLQEVVEIGTIEGDGPASSLFASILIMDTADVAAVLGRPTDLVSRIDLFLKPGADVEQVQRDVQALLKGQATVRTPEATGQSMREALTGLEIGFSLCGAVALVVGLFLVYNALSVSVAERRHEIGVLRSIGATRLQIGSLFAGESLVLGLVGAALGVPLGLGLAFAVREPILKTLGEVLIPIEIQPAKVSLLVLVLSGAAGVATALLAALLPALRAARDEPADAVRRVPPGGDWATRAFHIGACCVLLGIGLATILLRHQLPLRIGLYGGLVLVLLGLLLTTPLLAGLITHLLQPVARWFLPIEVRLAADNLARAPGRTGLVIAALAAGVTLMVQTAGVTRSNEDPIMDWIDRMATADLFVTAGGPLNSGSTNVALNETVGQGLGKIPGVRDVLSVRFRRPDFRNAVVFLISFDAQKYCELNRERSVSRGLESYERMAEPGTVLVSENFAAQHHVAEGDHITLGGPQGPVELKVVGVVVDYSWNRGTVVVDRRTYQDLFRDPLVDVFDVYYQADADPAAIRKQVQEWGTGQALFVTSRAELLSYLQNLVRRLFGIAYLQVGVVGIVAGLGVVTALLISILQRRRELGLLRAVGATRSQVLLSVLGEAVMMGLIGTVLGVLFGLPLEWFIVKVVMFEESGFTFPVLMPWVESAAISLLAILTATLAGLGPALHAVRLPITEAIAYE